MIMRGRRGRLADILLDIGAIQFGEFRLKLHQGQPDAPLSPIYINPRTPDHPTHPGPVDTSTLRLIGSCLAEVVWANRLRFDYVVGIPVAGDPLADELLRQLGHSQRLHLGKQIFADGSSRIDTILEDNFPISSSVLLVDNVITSANSADEALAVCDAVGLDVHHLLVLVDRQQGGSARLNAMGIKTYTVFTLYELLRHYVTSGKLSPDKAAEVVRYIGSN